LVLRQNAGITEIDKVVPVAASVKTKLGRGGTGEE